MLKHPRMALVCRGAFAHAGCLAVPSMHAMGVMSEHARLQPAVDRFRVQFTANIAICHQFELFSAVCASRTVISSSALNCLCKRSLLLQAVCDCAGVGAGRNVATADAVLGLLASAEPKQAGGVKDLTPLHPSSSTAGLPSNACGSASATEGNVLGGAQRQMNQKVAVATMSRPAAEPVVDDATASWRGNDCGVEQRKADEHRAVQTGSASVGSLTQRGESGQRVRTDAQDLLLDTLRERG